MKWILIAAYCLIASSASTSRAAALLLKEGDSFIHGRSKLHAAGWRADPAAHLSAGEYFGVDRSLIARGFFEVDICSLGKTYCIFQYIRGRSCLRLETEGEQIAEMRIVGWSSKCRESAADDPLVVVPAEVRFARQRQEQCEQFGDCDGIHAHPITLRKKQARHRNIGR